MNDSSTINTIGTEPKNYAIMKAYRYLSSEGVISTLKSGKIRISPVAAYFDQNEFEYDVADVRAEELQEFISRKGYDKAPLLTRLSLQKKYDICQRCAQETFKEKLISKFWVCCYSKRKDNAFMWETYTRESTGGVLEFDFGAQRKLHTVKYSDTKPTYNWTKDLTNEKIYEIVLHKPSRYSSEEELRELVPCTSFKIKQSLYKKEDLIDKSCSFLKNQHCGGMEFKYLLSAYCEKELNAVYLGCNASPNFINEVQGLLHNERLRHVKLYIMGKGIDGEIEFKEMQH